MPVRKHGLDSPTFGPDQLEDRSKGDALSICAQRPKSPKRLIAWLAAFGGILLGALGGDAAPGQSGRAADAERAVLTVDLSSIDKAYAEAKFVFELAGDPKGYQTFK